MKSRIPHLETFIKERNAALFSFDEKRIRAYMRKYGVPIPNNPKVFWGGVCKADLRDYQRSRASKGKSQSVA